MKLSCSVIQDMIPMYYDKVCSKESAALIEEHFHSKSTPYIHCGHFPFNEPSEKLLLSLGFTHYGQHALGKATIIDKIRFKV